MHAPEESNVWEELAKGWFNAEHGTEEISPEISQLIYGFNTPINNEESNHQPTEQTRKEIRANFLKTKNPFTPLSEAELTQTTHQTELDTFIPTNETDFYKKFIKTEKPQQLGLSPITEEDLDIWGASTLTETFTPITEADIQKTTGNLRDIHRQRVLQSTRSITILAEEDIEQPATKPTTPTPEPTTPAQPNSNPPIRPARLWPGKKRLTFFEEEDLTGNPSASTQKGFALFTETDLENRLAIPITITEPMTEAEFDEQYNNSLYTIEPNRKIIKIPNTDYQTGENALKGIPTIQPMTPAQNFITKPNLLEKTSLAPKTKRKGLSGYLSATATFLAITIGSYFSQNSTPNTEITKPNVTDTTNTTKTLSFSTTTDQSSTFHQIPNNQAISDSFIVKPTKFNTEQKPKTNKTKTIKQKKEGTKNTTNQPNSYNLKTGESIQFEWKDNIIKSKGTNQTNQPTKQPTKTSSIFNKAKSFLGFA